MNGTRRGEPTAAEIDKNYSLCRVIASVYKVVPWGLRNFCFMVEECLQPFFVTTMIFFNSFQR